MIIITTSNKQDRDLVVEALTNHGFEPDVTSQKRYWFFGKVVYKIAMSFTPRLSFLELLLQHALDKEDYFDAENIKKMIKIKKGLAA